MNDIKYKENCKIKNQKKFEIMKDFKQVYRININKIIFLNIFNIHFNLKY